MMKGNLTCNVCGQPFDSELEAQEHQRSAHHSSQVEKPQPGSESVPGDRVDVEQDEPRRERIA
jgi:hypothetical protein